MDINKEREAFERFKAEKIGIAYEELKADLDDCERRFGKRYAGWDFSDDWEIWQAAKASVAEGFVLMPKEPTKEIIARMTNTPIEVTLLCDNADIFLSEDEALIAYKAMIEAQEPSNE